MLTAASLLVSPALGRLPPPSVTPAEYPALVECTLDQRASDIEAMFAAQDRHHDQARKNGDLYVTEDELGVVEVKTSNGEVVEAARLFGQIMQSCHEFEVGRPLGFWPDQLRGDWRARMGMRWGIRSSELIDEESFALCLSRFRKKLVADYLASAVRSERRALWKSFLNQTVCQPAYPKGLKENRVRAHLLGLNAQRTLPGTGN